MARNGFGAAMNRVLNFVGLVDTDEEPQRSHVQDDGYDYDRPSRNGYTPTSRRDDRPRPQRPNHPNNPNYGSTSRSGSNRRGDERVNRPRDPYTNEWGTRKGSSRYNDGNIYDGDTTLQGSVNGYDEDFGYDDRYEPRHAKPRNDYDDRRAPVTHKKPVEEEDRRPVPVEPRSARSRSGEVVVFDVNDLEDCRMVILALIDNKTVIISVEALDKAMIRRVEDTLCGAVCALNATIRRTSEVSYVIAPSTIEVKGTRRTVERRY